MTPSFFSPLSAAIEKKEEKYFLHEGKRREGGDRR